MADYVLWIKAAHVIAVIAWIAGMMYLPRLFVYHCDAPTGSAQSETFKVMERRLLRGIINPSMVAVWVLGLTLVVVTQEYRAGWFQLKFLLVLVLNGVHGFFAGTVKRFARDANTRPARFYRIINEVPFVLVIAIVILAVVKPF